MKMNIIAERCIVSHNNKMFKYIYPKIDKDLRLNLINLAVYANNLEIFDYLIRYTNSYSWYQLFLQNAIVSKSKSIVDYIIQNLVPNKLTLFYCIDFGDAEIMKSLLNKVVVSDELRSDLLDRAEENEEMKRLIYNY